MNFTSGEKFADFNEPHYGYKLMELLRC